MFDPVGLNLAVKEPKTVEKPFVTPLNQPD